MVLIRKVYRKPYQNSVSYHMDSILGLRGPPAPIKNHIASLSTSFDTLSVS
jgi:hypothetical protein